MEALKARALGNCGKRLSTAVTACWQRLTSALLQDRRRRRRVFSLVTAMFVGLVMMTTPPASAEVFDKVVFSTDGDGWDITFHPTNQNYAFFVHHRGTTFGCLYRLDPDGNGPIEQGHGCFGTDGNGDSVYLLDLGGNRTNGLKSSAWVTSDGNTVYIPQNKGNNGNATIAKVDISDPDPTQWSVGTSVGFGSPMEEHSNSIMVDNVLWAINKSALLTYDTTTQTKPYKLKGLWKEASVYHADGRIWSVSDTYSLVCFDLSTDQFCTHGSFTDGVGAALGTSLTVPPNHVVEYRNQDGSFGGFCSDVSCVNANGAIDTNMVNGAVFDSGDHHNKYGLFHVTDQHLVIRHQPLETTQTYTCWDYTTQAECAPSKFTQHNTANPGAVYNVIQDPWNANCLWTNADDKIIGAWDIAYTGAFAKNNGGECDLTIVSSATTVTLTYDAQGGSGAPGDQIGNAASDVTVSTTEPTRDGYTFLGWDAAADGSGTDYAGGATYTLPNNGTATLYAQWQINTGTLAYDPQGGTGQPSDQTGDAASDVTVSTTEPTRDGYTFTGWDTAANGSGTDYASGATYTLPNSGTETLYAQWQINTVTLAYDPQGGTGQPSDQTGDAASDVTVSTTEPTRDGYTFTGWDTAANGSGTDYASGATYTLPNSGTDTLYAQWAPVPVTVATVTLTYDPQGGTGEPDDQTGPPLSDVTVSSTVPTRDGYTFLGWDTVADGSGIDYSGGATYTLPNSGTDTLYAQWQINTVTLAYDPQGGSGEPGDQTGDAASDVTVSTTEPTRDGYTFTGWDTVANGSGTDYSGGATYTLPNSGTGTLYAQWQINTVTLAYDPQGGSGEPSDQTGDAASDVTVSSTVPTRDSYTFTGWDTVADGSGTDYSGGDSYTLPNSGTDTLYAQWTPDVTLTYDPLDGTGEPDDQTGPPLSDVTVSSTEPTRDGYTFAGWDTVADGSGTDYSGGATYTLPSSGTDTLYAQWTPDVTLTYDPLDGTGEPDDQTGPPLSDVTVSSTEPTRDGYTFTGWDTVADGSGTDYSGGATYTLPSSGTDTLYAQWTPDVTLTYDPLDGTGEPDDQTGPPLSDVTVSSTEPTRDGYTFAGWDTVADGSGTDYSGGATYTLPSSGTDTLYAQWTPDVTLTYDPLDGTGEPDDQTGPPLSDVTVSSTEPTRDGYTFLGWDVAADGSGTDYAGGDPYTLPNNGTDTLYAQWQINTVTLAYDPQGGTGQPGDQTGDAASDVTVSSTEPTRDGYTFLGWDSAANGSGTDYAGGDPYTLPNNGTDTLYAQWQINTVTLAYDPRGGTGQPGDQTGDAASDVTVSSTVPTRDGYTFLGWDSAANGSGTDYAGGDPYTLPNNGTDTLYAQWQINTVTLAYDPRGGTGQPGDQTGDAASDVTVSSTVPTRDGYTFLGWDSAANGSGTDYAGGDPYTLPNNGTDTLYAQWQFNTVTLVLTGDPESDVTVSATEPTRDGYTFTGWNTALDGSGTSYSDGDTVTLPNSGTDTLYAQWQINTVTLTYDAQGGSGEPGDQSGDAASDVTVSSTVPTRNGYTFTGWNTAADGSGMDCVGGDTVTLPNSDTIMLYAQWTPVVTTTGAEPAIPVPLLPALLLLLTSLLLAAVGIKRFV